MADNDDVNVVVRRRWNDLHTARVPLSALREYTSAVNVAASDSKLNLNGARGHGWGTDAARPAVGRARDTAISANIDLQPWQGQTRALVIAVAEIGARSPLLETQQTGQNT
jgi:hypothetical protein